MTKQHVVEKLEPIGPDANRRWPPPHAYMDEHGNWWEAEGRILELRQAKHITIEGNTFLNDEHAFTYSQTTGNNKTPATR